MSTPKAMLFHQARMATGSVRNTAGQRMGSQVRFASSSSTASSSSKQSFQKIAPIAVAASLAFGAVAYTSKPVSLESTRRKPYSERMIIEKKKNEKKEEANDQGGTGSGNGDKEETASAATDELEEQATQENAFNPETNEINWDCPCLGGMAQGPCGEEFKAAFSCFVFSEQDPKGIECVDKFSAMQACFRRHPDHYKEELEDEESFEREEEAREASAGAGTGTSTSEDDEGMREFRSEMSKEK